MKKIIIILVAVGLLMSLMTGCSTKSVKYSEDATPENPMILKLPHNMNEQHTVHLALKNFSEQVFEKTNHRIKIEIYPNAQLGSENEVLEQLMAGVVDLTKVSAPGLATYNEGYHTFGLPYVFDNIEHYYKCMDSNVMKDFFMSTEKDGFIGVTYYTSGARSFYCNKPIITPGDLKGLKIRVQDMRSQTDMVKALGGTPVAMAYGDVYTALQTGIIDGTENNETALSTGKHGEVCKVYSWDEHTMIPDILVISSNTWDRLTKEDQDIILETAKASTEAHKKEWETATQEAVNEAKETMGVTFVDNVDKEAFREATKGMVHDYSEKYPNVKFLLEALRKVK